MKKTFHIARNELHNLYYSPLAWVFMVVMMILAAGIYINYLEMTVRFWQQGGFSLLPRGHGAYTSTVTDNFLHGIIENVYLYLPLITMALVSREMGSGTIKLLYSSPVKVREVVLGKLLGLLILLTVYLIMLLLPVAAFCLSLKDPDYGELAASYFGFFLVICAIASIGLFISSLSRYQVVAAIITFLVFSFFRRATSYWQDIEWFRNLSYYLDISDRSRKLFMGLITVADVCYCLVIIGSFTCFTMLRLKSVVAKTSLLTRIGRYAVIIVVATAIGIVSNNPFVNKYFDATRDDKYTITKNMQQWLSKLNKGPLEITVFANILDDRLEGFGFTPRFARRRLDDVFRGIVRFKPDTKIRLVNYYDTDSAGAIFKENRGLTLVQIAARRADAFSIDIKDVLSPNQINKIVDVKKEEYGNFFQFKYQGKIANSRPFEDADILYGTVFPNDEHYAAVFSKLLNISTPTVLCLTDELERGPYSNQLRDYKQFTNNLSFNKALGNRGFIVDTLSLKKKNIPDSIAALIISDPRVPFCSESLKKIKRYIADGGNLLITAEPDRREILEPVLDELGVVFRPGILIQPSESYASNRIFNRLTDSAKRISAQFERIINDKKETLGNTAFPILMDGAMALEPKPKNGFEYIPLMTTDPATSWNRVAPLIEDSLQVRVPRRPDDERGSFVTMYLLKRMVHGKQQRIIVAGDADYLTRPLAHYRLNALNFEYNLGMFNYFTYGQFPANVTWPRPQDNAFTIKTEDIWKQEIIFYYIIPAILVIVGSVILIRRKRK